MWIARLVGELMVNPMGGDPNHWSTFQAQRSAYRQNIFQPLRNLVASVRKQAMITHADPGIDGDDMKHHRDGQRGPAEKEQRCDGSKVEQEHEAKHHPID